MRNARTTRSERGYNLVEVLIAMAILGTVIMSIMTLFIFGRRNVYSGRQMTRATSVATHVMEDINALTLDTFYTAFGITATTTMATNTVSGVSYPTSIIRNTGNYTVPTAPARNYFGAWDALLAADRMTGATVTLVILPRDLGTANNPLTARRLVIRGVVQWREGGRARQVSIDVTKLNRKIV
jgi:prepilin-type N-terminal cleavage/methylation domain-containing protein